jgi:hypothetical protein
VTTPPGPTGTISSIDSPVSGSYSTGGTSTRPSRAFTPTIFCSVSAEKNAPRTGPTERR